METGMDGFLWKRVSDEAVSMETGSSPLPLFVHTGMAHSETKIVNK